MKNYFLLIIAVFILLISCISEENKSNNIKTVAIDIGKKHNAYKFNELFEVNKNIILDENKQAIISSISSVLYYGDRLYISDDNENIYLYDTSGVLINRIEPGKGPGQYPDLLDIQLDKSDGSIYAWSLLANKMFVYDKNGKFKSKFSIPIPIYKFYLLDKNTILCYTNFAANSFTINNQNNTFNSLFVINKKENKWVVKYQNISQPVKFSQQLISWANTSPFCKSDLGIIFCPPFKNKVFLYDSKEMVFNEFINFDFKNYKIPENFFEKYGSVNVFNNLKSKKIIHGWENFFIYGNVFCFTTGVDKEQTVIYNISNGKYTILDTLFDKENELILHIMPNTIESKKLIAYINPSELFKINFKNKQSLGYKLKTQVKEFDNPIILFYSYKNNKFNL